MSERVFITTDNSIYRRVTFDDITGAIYIYFGESNPSDFPVDTLELQSDMVGVLVNVDIVSKTGKTVGIEII